jgi:hypothetical protein
MYPNANTAVPLVVRTIAPSHEAPGLKPFRDFSPERTLAGFRAYERSSFRWFPRLRRFPVPTWVQCL